MQRCFAKFRLGITYREFSMPAFSPVTHVIFDLDGTILDTETIYSVIYGKVLQKYGKEFNEQVRVAITGKKEKDACGTLVEMLQLPITADAFNDQITELSQPALSNPAMKPGAERVIRHLSASNVPIAVATSSGVEICRIKTANHSEVFGLFHHIVNGSSDPEVVHGKPAPDIFLIAARRFPTPAEPKECLVFEDSPNGVAGAKAAGMQVVMIPEEYCPAEKTREATLVIESFEQFVPEMFGLTPYPKQ